MNEIRTVGIAGAGTMGRGIAEVAAAAGYEVRLYDPFPEALAGALERIRASLERAREKGRLAEEAGAVLQRIRPESDPFALAGAELVIEAVPEELETKREIFKKIGGENPDLILASNTSTLSITAIAAPVPRPGRVLGMHFFNPVPRMRLVEVIPGKLTEAGVLEDALAFVRRLGKEPVLAKDTPGFVVNRVARPYYGEALVLAGLGVSVEAIDRIMEGLGFPMGPFALMDFIGLDVNFAAAKSVWDAYFHHPRYRPHPLQAQMVAAGYLGRKSGRGFYAYPRERKAPPVPEPGRPMRARVLGQGPLARALAERLGDAGSPQVVVDARVALDEKAFPVDLPPGLPVLTLTWGHSATLARARYPQAPEVVGFSLVPPLEPGRLVELSAPLGEAVPVWARDFFAALGFAAEVIPDQAGGVGFRILAMLVNEAASALAEGVGDEEGIDRAMRLGTRYPRGPLAWGRVMGLSQLLAGLEGLFAELGEDRYRPDPLLRKAAAVGKWR